MQAQSQIQYICAAPFTVRGQPTFIQASQSHLLYFNGPTAFLRPLTPQFRTFFVTHRSTVVAAKLSSDFKRIATIDEKGCLMVHVFTIDQKELKIEYTHEGFFYDAKAIDWTGDNKRIAVVGNGKNKFGRVVLVETAVDVGEISAVTANLSTVAFRPERPYKMVVGGQEHIVKAYEGPPYKFTVSKQTHASFINQLKFSPDGKTLVSVGSDRKIVIYDGLSFQVKVEIPNAHQGSVFGVSWVNNAHFVTCSSDKKIRKWNLTGQKVAELIGTTNQQQGLVDAHIVGITSCPSQNAVFYVLLNGQIKQTCGSLLAIKRSFEGHRNKVTKILQSKQLKNQIILLDSNGKILLHDYQTKRTIRLCRNVVCHNRLFLDADLSSNNLYYLTGQNSVFSINLNDKNSTQKKGINPQNDAVKFILANNNTPYQTLLTFKSTKMQLWAPGEENKVICQSKLSFQPTAILGTYDEQNYTRMVLIGGQKGIIELFHMKIKEKLIIEQKVTIQSNQNKITHLYMRGPLLFAGDSMGMIQQHLYSPNNAPYLVKTCTMGYHTTMITSIQSNINRVFTFSMDNKQSIWSVQSFMRGDTLSDLHTHGILCAEIIDEDTESESVVTSGGDYLIKIRHMM